MSLGLCEGCGKWEYGCSAASGWRCEKCQSRDAEQEVEQEVIRAEVRVEGGWAPWRNGGKGGN